MFNDGALLISPPARELERIQPPGSLFGAADIDLKALTPALGAALELLLAACRLNGCEPIFVARPEIFTHGDSLDWLRARVKGARSHVALSDATTARLVPGLKNHVFFFGASRSADAAALDRLARRAPELLGQFETQINSAFAFGARSPEAVAVTGCDADWREPPRFYPIALNAFSIDDSLFRTLRGGPLPALPGKFAAIDDVALTETSLEDRDFMRLVADKLSRAYFAPERALVLRLPPASSDATEFEDRVRAVLTALVAADPRAPLAAAPGAFLAAGDVDAATLAAAAPAIDFLCNDDFAFWTLAPARYRAARTVSVHARANNAAAPQFSALIEALIERKFNLIEATRR